MRSLRPPLFWRALAAAVLLGCALASSAEQLVPADVGAMQRAIDGQLAAFSRDDEQGAFDYASPGIRARFGTAATFAAMVREQYAVVYRPASRTFLQPVVEDGDVFFPVQMSGGDGRVWIALYLMQRVGEDWKIAGCQLLPGTAAAT